MIKTYACKETEKIFNQQFSRKVPEIIQRLAMRKLWMLDAAVSLNDLSSPPANNLEKLRGDLRGRMSIRINQQYRICFIWNKGNAYDVEIMDYH